MKTVYKYPIYLEDKFKLDLPLGAQLLTVQTQYEIPQLWVLVDPTRPLGARWIRVAGTGHAVTELIHQYLGTFQLHGGSLVFHVFEIAEPIDA